MRSLFLSGFCFICLVISSASSFSQEHSVDAVRDWTAAALTEAMTFNFANYEEHKKMNRRLFTDSGYKSFYKAMDNSQIPAYVTREKIMLSLELACTPELTEKREIPQKAWVFETPAMIVYNAGTRVKKIL